MSDAATASPSVGRCVARWATGGVLGLLLVALGNWWVDPLQLYRPANYPPLYSEMQRYRNPGLARQAPQPLVVMGTSASVNLDPELLEAKLGLPALNLAMQGASAHEQSLLLRLALRTGQVREVVWDLNFEYFRGAPDWVSSYDGAFPAYLYDDAVLNDVTSYLLTVDTCKKSLRVLAGRAGLLQRATVPLANFHRPDPMRRYGIAAVAADLEARRTKPEAFRRLLPEYAPGLLEASFSQNCLALIREFPQVRFRLYFPPFSRAYFTVFRDIAPELRQPFVDFRRLVFEQTRNLGNVEVHDLQVDWTVVEDLQRFADSLHYDPPTHARVLEQIRDRALLASPARLAEFETWLGRIFAGKR